MGEYLDQASLLLHKVTRMINSCASNISNCSQAKTWSEIFDKIILQNIGLLNLNSWFLTESDPMAIRGSCHRFQKSPSVILDVLKSTKRIFVSNLYPCFELKNLQQHGLNRDDPLILQKILESCQNNPLRAAYRNLWRREDGVRIFNFVARTILLTFGSKK